MLSGPVTISAAAAIKSRARELGFDPVGIASAAPSERRDYFRRWLDDGQAGEMHYLAERFAERTDLSAYLPGVASVICVGINYHVPLEIGEESDALSGRVARYALGDDYHEIIRDRLRELADWIRQQWPGTETRACVDTAPVMEKELAARAGIGWLGKNTCIINQRLGSWLFLGEIVTTLALPADEPAIDRCGSCRACLDSCPTQAITAAYQVDARRCISYLTIEHRGEIEPEMAAAMGDWVYGCDICQDVCPWNRRAPASAESGFQPRFTEGKLDLPSILNWQPEDYRRQLRGSAMKRVKLPILQRNVGIALVNVQATKAGQSSRSPGSINHP